MKTRCTDPRADSFKNYGGRGIRICDAWLHSYQAFVDDMGECPDNLTLERNDSDGNYEPANCRWATRKEQARNTRRKRVTNVEGVPVHISELSEQSGVSPRTIAYRLGNGWPLEKALSQEKHYNNRESIKKACNAHAAKKRAQTHCKRGHEFTSENVYLYKGIRACRTCRRAADRAQDSKNK